MDYRSLAIEAANRHGVPVPLFLAMVQAESAWKPGAVSHAGASGLAQLMPATARAMGVTDIFDPAQNLDGGAKYLSQQLRTFGDPRLALAAYNAGPGAVQKHGGIPPYRETQNYVATIMKRLGTPNQNLADDAMRAIGKDPIRPPLPTNLPVSTPAKTPEEPKPMGLFDYIRGDGKKMAPDGTVFGSGGFFSDEGFMNRDRAHRLAAALEGMTLNPNQQMIQSLLGGVQEREKAKREAGVATRTAQWLVQQGRPELAELISGGSLSPKEAVSLAMARGQDPTALMQNVEYLMGRGMSMDQALQVVKGGSTTNINISPDGSLADRDLAKELMKGTGELWLEYSRAGGQAVGTMNDMVALQELARATPHGPLSGRLAELFPEFSDAATAFQSIVARTAPTMRVPGSGATSDLEFQKMLDSLPKLRNRPEANVAIADMFKAKAELNIERAKIVQAYQLGQMSFAEAQAAIGQLDARSIMPPTLRRALDGLTGARPDTEPAQPDTGGEWITDPATGLRYRKVR